MAPSVSFSASSEELKEVTEELFSGQAYNFPSEFILIPPPE